MATATKKDRAIELHNVGTIADLAIPIPEGGGVTVLRGFSGVGKSTALNAVRALTGGEASLSKRDGSLKGEIVGLGASISLQKSTRRKGEAEVTSIDGRLSLADLIDPKIKDPLAADAKRIKALVSLASDSGPELFYDLADSPAEFGELVGDELLDCADVVARATRVKRCFEKAARQAEADADQLSGRAKQIADELAPLEGAEIPDPGAVQQKLDWLLTRSGELDAKRKAAWKAQADAELGRKKLATLNVTGQSIEFLQAEKESRQSAYTSATAELSAAQRALEEAQRRLEAAHLSQHAASDALDDAARMLIAAEERDEILKQLREQIAAAEAVEAPSAEQIEQVQTDLAETRGELQRALSQKAIADKRPELDRLEAAQQQAAAKAARYRQAAHRAEAKLTELVNSGETDLRVVDGRLITTTERGDTPFAELSDGERCRMALRLILPRIGPNDLVVLDQALWEGLPPLVHQEVADEARALGINIVTARCSNDKELIAEVL